jgi:hypothetical protein
MFLAFKAHFPPTLLTRADEQILKRMSVACAQFRECCIALRSEGALVPGRERSVGPEPKQAAEELERCATGLGLSPAVEPVPPQNPRAMTRWRFS